MKVNRVLFPLLLAAAVGQAGSVHAVEVHGCESSNKKEITAVLDGKTTSVNRYFCIQTASTVPKIVVDPSDFATRNNADVIDQGNVRLAQETSVQKGQPIKVLITFGGFGKPGVYYGSIELRDATAPPGTGAKFEVQLHLLPKPNLTILPAASTFQFVRCRYAWTCKLFAKFASTSLVDKSKSITIVNQTRSPIQITSLSLAVRGERSGAVLGDADWKPDKQELSLGEGKSATISLTLPDRDIPSDKYQGSLRLIVDHLDDPLTPSILLNVRDGPVLPLVTIIVGIAISRLIQLANSPRLQTQTKLLQYFYVLQYASASITDPDMQRYLAQKFSDARQSIELASEMDVEASQKLDSIRQAIELWSNLQGLITIITAITDAGRRATLEGEAGQLRTAILADNLLVAQTQLTALRADVQQAAPALGGASRVNLMTPAVKPVQKRAPRGIEKFLLYLSGGLPINAETAYRYVIPLGYVLLLVSLVVFGYYNYYVRSGETLGAGGLSDYLSLFLWGFSVDIAQRTLQILPIARN